MQGEETYFLTLRRIVTLVDENAIVPMMAAHSFAFISYLNQVLVQLFFSLFFFFFNIILFLSQLYIPTNIIFILSSL